MLKPKGRAVFVVANRRYHQAACLAMATALTQRYAREGDVATGLRASVRPAGRNATPAAASRYSGPASLYSMVMRWRDMGRQLGFDAVEVIPLDPDPAGGRTITRLCQDAGASDTFAQGFRSARRYRRPAIPQPARSKQRVRVQPGVADQGDRAGGARLHRPADRATDGLYRRGRTHRGCDAAMVGRTAGSGHAGRRRRVTVGGWCLANIDALSVRITVDQVVRQAPGLAASARRARGA